MSYDITSFAVFAVLGTLGGFAHVMMDSESWADLKKFGSFKMLIIGTIIGVIYTFLHSDYNFPNSIMVFVSGYMGTDFMKAIIDKFGKKAKHDGGGG